MPSPDTFSIPPISRLLDRWLDGRISILDPFSRNSKRGTLTNDLNPKIDAMYHMDAVEFLDLMVSSGVIADCFLFDPPYSPRQISECYHGIGRQVTASDTRSANLYKRVKDAADASMAKGAIAICFGWNSGGMGKTRGYKLEEILLVAHGGAHNDTIVTVETKE